MSALSPASKKAIANLRAFTASPTNYYKCPLARRAAVLILLFADLRGDLRVVLTIRSAGLKNYAGQAALPGGKADTLAETPFQTARREAFEEIGLPMSDDKLPPGYTVEHLTELPTHLAMTELGVRPCVAYLKAPPISSSSSPPSTSPSSSPVSSSQKRLTGDAAKDILPTLDAREVAAVFTAPFANLLAEQDLEASVREKVPGEWYKGSWHSWHETAWRMHQFFVPVFPSSVFLARGTSEEEVKKREERRWWRRKTLREEKEKGKKKGESGGLAKRATGGGGAGAGAGGTSGGLNPPLPREFYRPQQPQQQTSGSATGQKVEGKEENNDPLRQPRYRVFGMTARILVDCARVAYGREPEFEHNSHFGDEDMIERLIRIGRLGEVRKPGEMLTRDVMMEAAKAKM